MPAVQREINWVLDNNGLVIGYYAIGTSGPLQQIQSSVESQLTLRYGGAQPILIMNQTASYPYYLQPQANGASLGYWGATASYCFQVTNAAGNLVTLSLDNSGDLAIPGTFSLGSAGTPGVISVVGPAASNKGMLLLTGASPDWYIGTDTTAQSGANVGANLQFNSYADNGSLLGTPLSINRATGTVTLTESAATPGLVLNNTDAYLYFIQPQNSGVTIGYWGADATYCFRVANSAGTLATLTLDNTGAMTLPGVLTVNNTLVVTGGISNTGSISTTTLTAAALVGRTTAPTAGQIGEEIIVPFTSVSIVSNTSTNVGTLPLTAGVWDVSGAAAFTESSGGAWQMSLGVNTVSATLPATGFYAQGVQAAAGGGYALVSPIKRVTLSASTNIFLVASSTFTAGTMVLSGFVRAVRVA